MINLQGLDLNLLRTLNVLLSENNVTRAAQRLNLSQPSVSVQLARLREIFADPLLLPGPRGMQPTARADELRGPLRDALLALELFGAPFSLIALIGIMLLIGIVKKNAIMMVDFALDAQRNGNLTPDEAIFQACLLRFRPIMMTTLAALFGALPLVISGGDGSELRQPLGITIVGGLVMSQLLTLYTTPVVYLFFDRLRLRFSRKKRTTVTE